MALADHSATVDAYAGDHSLFAAGSLPITANQALADSGRPTASAAPAGPRHELIS